MTKLKRRIALLLAMVMLTGMLPVGTVAADGSGVSILLEGTAVDQLELLADEVKVLTAHTSGFTASSYSWQVLADRDAGLWVSIDGCKAAELSVSRALVGSMLDGSSRAWLRCVVTDSAGSRHTSDAIPVVISRETAVSQQQIDTVYYPADITGQPEIVTITEEQTVPAAEEPTGEAADAGIAPASYTPAAEDPSADEPAGEPEAQEDTIIETVDIEVRYVFLDGTSVHDSTFFNVRKGTDIAHAVNLPIIVGYNPFLKKDSADATYYDKSAHRLYYSNGTHTVLADTDPGYNADDDKLSGTYAFSFTDIQEPQVITILYLAAPTTYTVVHYTEDLVGEGYTEVARYTPTGLTGYPVADNLADVTFAGFTPMQYQRLNIAATGNTVINIYHHRNYYLVDFNLDDNEAFGAEPVYVRFGTSVQVSQPTRPGWTFNGWVLDQVQAYGADDWSDATASQKASYAISNSSITVPAMSLRYKAQWTQGNSYYTVVYWREAESAYGYSGETKYEYWGSQLVGATDTDDGIVLTGGVQTGAAVDYTQHTAVPSSITVRDNIDESAYFFYNLEKTAASNSGNLIVDGDGSTVVNIYYDRHSYNLKFYYAAKKNNSYYVVGGSTYFFGNNSSGFANRNDDVKLFGRYMSEYTDQTGTVDALPTLNSNGSDKNYTQGTAQDGNYTYYYIAFQAKYGMNISSIWPVDVFNPVTRTSGGNNGGWTDKTAWVSAWNGEYNVWYSQNNSNQTIKGKYDKLDYKILWRSGLNGSGANSADTDEMTLGNLTSTGGTVAYLCFWENGANVNWSVPELYRYRIWKEALDQSKTPSGTEGVDWKRYTYAGTTKYYIWDESYDTVDNSTVAEQTSPSIFGFTCVSGPVDGGKISGFDTSVYRDAFNVDFFYDRNRYTLEFNNRGELLSLDDASGVDMAETTIRYGVSLYYSADPNMTPDQYPEDLEEDGYEFEGWYTSSTFAAGTKFVFDETTTMPAENLYLYANWVLKDHTVQIYAHETDIFTDKTIEPSTLGLQTVLHNNKAVTPNDPRPTDGSLFAGWFYYELEDREPDGNGGYKLKDGAVAQAYSFDTMVVKHDLKIFARYDYNFTTRYVIHFYERVVHADGTSEKTTNQVAPDFEGTGVAGDHVTVVAATGDALNEGYRTNYFPDPYSDSLLLGTDPSQVTETAIYYTRLPNVPYTVHYVNAVTGAELHADKVVNDNVYAVVTENYQYISGFVPDAYQKTLALSGNGEGNEITFYYTPSNEGETMYRVVHYFETVNAGEYALNASLTRDFTAAIGSNVTASAVTGAEMPTGFQWASGRTSVIQNGTGTSWGSTQNTQNATVTVQNLPQQGVLISLYYDRISYGYTIHFHEYGVGVDGDTDADLVLPKTGQARYGTVLIPSPVSIPGYTLISDATGAQLRISNDETQNQYIFYYQEKQVDIRYEVVAGYNGVLGGSVSLNQEFVEVFTGTVTGSTAQPNPGYHLVGWYLDANCTIPVDSGLLSSDGATLIPQKVNNMYEEATYYAKFTRSTANLTISTSFTTSQGGYSSLDPEKTFIFRIAGVEGTQTEGTDILVTIQGKGNAIIEDLPLGDYTVTELTDWSWRYDSVTTAGQPNVTHSIHLQGNASDTHILTRTDNQWLDGNTWADNHYTTEHN